MNEMSKSLEVKTGLRQGDAYSPVLFNLALDQVVRDMKVNRCMGLVRNRTLLAHKYDSYSREISSTIKLIKANQKIVLKINKVHSHVQANNQQTKY